MPVEDRHVLGTQRNATQTAIPTVHRTVDALRSRFGVTAPTRLVLEITETEAIEAFRLAGKGVSARETALGSQWGSGSSRTLRATIALGPRVVLWAAALLFIQSTEAGAGERLCNFVQTCTFPSGSCELSVRREIFSDSDVSHLITENRNTKLFYSDNTYFIQGNNQSALSEVEEEAIPTVRVYFGVCQRIEDY